MKLLNNLFTKKYNEKAFWNNWSSEFIKDPWQTKIHPQHKWLLKQIMADNPESILELGCGFGRNIKFLLDNGINSSAITGVDISEEMIKLAKGMVQNKNVKFVVSDLLRYKSEWQFDLVFTHGVLMHIPKKKIRRGMRRLARFSKDKIILIEQNYEANNDYTYLHNYREILKSLPVDILEFHSDKRLGLDLIYVKVR